MTRSSVLVTCGVFEPGFRGGGPIKSVAHIVDSAPDDMDLLLVTGDRDIGSTTPYAGLSGTWVHRGRCEVFYLNPRSPRHWWRLWERLRNERFDLLYANSLWSPVYSLLPLLATRLGLLSSRRILIAPRGELSPGALALKARKKRLFLRAWSPMLRRADVVWHASTDREAEEIRRAGIAARVEINADQTDLPRAAATPTESPAADLRLVFIGRIARKKNVDLVLRALALVSKPVSFDIFGPIEDARYWDECTELIEQLPGHVRVRYGGELLPQMVRRTFGRYDAFAFPTRGENFGHVIAESLSAACPVVCSDETPWTSILTAGGGIVVDELTVRGFGDALERLANADRCDRMAMKLRSAGAYRRWRDGALDRNILEQVRSSQWWSPVHHAEL